MKTIISVLFAEHLKPSDIRGLVAGLVHRGTVETVSERNLIIRTDRASRLEGLKKWLNHLNSYGRLSWSEITQKEADELPRMIPPVPESQPAILKGRVPALQEPRPKKKLNAAQRKALKAADLQLFLKEYGRKAQKGQEPNDRRYSRKTEQALRHIKPEELDKLLHDGDDE